jgi:hypothetical protein
MRAAGPNIGRQTYSQTRRPPVKIQLLRLQRIEALTKKVS